MSAANAIRKHLQSCGHEVVVLDTIEYINPILNKTITEGYEFLAKNRPSIYRVMYNTANHKKIKQAITSINALISRKLVPFVKNYRPDIIVTTHPFSAEMAAKLKRIDGVTAKVLCVMTDYAPHRTWINDSIDAYVVSNDGMVKKMYDMGVPYWKVYPFGIPIEGGFYTKRDRSIILKEMGLNPTFPTILIMAGSLGLGDVSGIYDEILNISVDFQTIIITGKNKKLYELLEKMVYENHEISHAKLRLFRKYLPNFTKDNPLRNKKIEQLDNSLEKIRKINKKRTRILHFTNEVDKYMQIADLIITKPGGLTITEALACRLPMAIFDAIPGQEEENADFLVSNNMAIKLANSYEGANQIKELLQNAKKLQSMKDSCEKFDKSNALKNIQLLMNRLCPAT